MNREYIRVKKPTTPIPHDIRLLKSLDDEFWKKWVFYYLLDFYKKYDKVELDKIIKKEKEKKKPRTENKIAKFIRVKLNGNKSFGYLFSAIGENTNDEEIEGFYDITILSTIWESKNFHFECKNLDGSTDLINKYVCYNKGKNVYDGGVLRYFNGKYAQRQSFGGMIGFMLGGNTQENKEKLIKKMESKLVSSPEGDLIRILDNSIEDNNFTFDSLHKRLGREFTIHHLLFDFTT